MSEQVKLLDLVYDLACRYVERQRYAYDLMMALRPDRILYYDKTITTETIVALKEKTMNVPTSGEWHGWHYIMRPEGCFLKRIMDHEPIEWYLPDPRTFDRDHLAVWIEWHLMQRQGTDTLRTIREVQGKQRGSVQDLLFPVLHQLREAGRLHQHNTQTNYGRYTLPQETA
jgi:hypothetical protein